jgi:CubicO group peptidase (beta-lactamase class C family)
MKRETNLLNDELVKKLQKFAGKHAPGLQYQVVTQNHIEQCHSSGLADISNNVQVTEATQFAVYSITKVVTAIAILQLVDSELLRIEDSVADYLPNFQINKKIKIKHLLSQSSGLKNPIPARWVHLPEEHEQFHELLFFNSIFEKYKKLDFEPGEKYQYSNISYWLLALALEEITGKRFCDYVDQRIFLPLGLQADAFRISSQKKYATGYLSRFSLMNIFKGFVADSKFWHHYEKSWLKIEPCYVNGPGFGGLFANSHMLCTLISDLLKENPQILSLKSKELLFTQQLSNNGKPFPMSLGFHIDSLNGFQYFYKEGGDMGFHAEMRIYPFLNRGSVLLTNSGSFQARKRLTELDQTIISHLPLSSA